MPTNLFLLNYEASDKSSFSCELCTFSVKMSKIFTVELLIFLKQMLVLIVNDVSASLQLKASKVPGAPIYPGYVLCNHARTLDS